MAEKSSDVDPFLHVLSLHTRLEQSVSRRLRRVGSGVSEYRVLRLLSQRPEREMRLLDLTDALGLDQSSVSRLVVRLEAVGEVRREPCGDDRRGVFCVLTEAGAERERELTPVFAQAALEALDRLRSEPGAAAAAAPLLRSIADDLASAPPPGR
ncbi:MAG TPA: MarR family transcriptional regulator [Nocardioides sp.]|nr:MarR family transcriptional regulator [Nocardioides sp.]